MRFNDLIGYEIFSALEIIKKNTDKKIIKKDNNSYVKKANTESVVRIKEYDDYIEVITSKFMYLE